MTQEKPTPSKTDTGKDTSKIEWLTVQQAAYRIQVHPRTIQKLIHDGELKASRIGSALRIRKGEIDAYMENHPAT